MKRFAIVVSALAVVLALTTSAVAQQVEYKVTVKAEEVRGSATDHFLTFTGPVQIPDVTLPAGTYVFSLVAPSIVQVTSADRSLQYAMFFTAPVQRLDPTDDQCQHPGPRCEMVPAEPDARVRIPLPASGDAWRAVSVRFVTR